MYNVPYTKYKFDVDSLNASGIHDVRSLTPDQIKGLKNIKEAAPGASKQQLFKEPEKVVAGQGKGTGSEYQETDPQYKTDPEQSVSLHGTGMDVNKILMYSGIGVGILLLIYIIKK